MQPHGVTMQSIREYQFQNSDSFAVLRRYFKITIYLPALISFLLYIYPTSGTGTRVILLGTKIEAQHIAATAFALFSAFFWLARYLRYGVLFPFPKFSRSLNDYRSAGRDSSQDALEQLRRKYISELQRRKYAESNSSGNGFESITRRLSTEISALSRRNATNLAFGITTATLGILFISTAIFDSRTPPASLEAFSLQFIPRLCLVILIELFAYFFLRLYRDGLAEIKYFQNELTNIESRRIALDAAEKCGDSKAREKVISIIAKTERNGILEKGQTTAAIQLAALEQKTSSGVLKALTDVLRTKPIKEKPGDDS